MSQTTPNSHPCDSSVFSAPAAAKNANCHGYRWPGRVRTRSTPRLWQTASVHPHQEIMTPPRNAVHAWASTPGRGGGGKGRLPHPGLYINKGFVGTSTAIVGGLEHAL